MQAKSTPSGWILCGGMRRAGSTLQYQIASELIERLGYGERTAYHDPVNQAQALSSPPSRGLSTFKMHEVTPAARKLCSEDGAVALYVYRDLRDVISSLQEKNGVRLEGRALEKTIRQLMRSDAEWRALPRVHVARYEEMSGNIEEEARKIAQFLGLECTARLPGEIARDLSFEAQSNRIAGVPDADFVRVNETTEYDRRSLLHRNHLQSGEAGRYRRDLDAGQIDRIVTLAAEWLTENRYQT